MNGDEKTNLEIKSGKGIFGHDIIVIGASAGGVETLVKLTRNLPGDIPAALFIVLHVPPDSPSLLPGILNRHGQLKAIHPEDGTKIEQGYIYIAPPNNHLIIEQDYVRIIRGPRENRHRPAVDPLFRSAAQVYGPRVIGVILSGALDDGTAGLLAVKRMGGLTVVQDPKDAQYTGMPLSAIQNVPTDYIKPVSEMSLLLNHLASEPAQILKSHQTNRDMRKEIKVAEFDINTMEDENKPGEPSQFSCPECGGVLWEIQDGHMMRYRCRVGHAFSVESMQAEQVDALEHALWVALKTIEENISLTKRMTHTARERQQFWMVQRFEERLKDAEQNARVLREVIAKSRVMEEPGKTKTDLAG
jgi:two-component system chemotaxis response regulator CheB